MLTSRDLLEATGISRATLNNYIAQGLLPKPEVRRQPPAPGEPAATLGYFPDWALPRIEKIQEYKRSGLSMNEIGNQLSSTPNTSDASGSAAVQIGNRGTERRLPTTLTAGQVLQSESVQVTIDHLPYPAYMVNYEFQLIWINGLAQQEFFGREAIPDRAEDRLMFSTLLGWAAELPEVDRTGLIDAHLRQIAHRLPRQAFARCLAPLGESERQWLLDRYDHVQAKAPATADPVRIKNPNGDENGYQIVTMNFREGVLVVYAPESQSAEELTHWLSRRDSVIRTLLGQRLPVLTPVAVLVGDLQNSVRICSELPPEEYFELINQIWARLDPIFREYYGTYGKHTGDGMVYYFFPQPDRPYLMSAVQCALKIREAMRRLSQEWQLRKGWNNVLYMNIGLNEGEEWLGTFKTNTSYELVVLGQTINSAARLSDFARFGKIWATKNHISKLSPADRESISYGVERETPEGKVFIKNTFAQMGSMLNMNEPKHAKMNDINSLAVAEITSQR